MGSLLVRWFPSAVFEVQRTHVLAGGDVEDEAVAEQPAEVRAVLAAFLLCLLCLAVI